jgi:hypothetical protein
VIGSPVLAAEPLLDSGLVSGGALVGRKMLVQRKLQGQDGDGKDVLIDPSQNVYSKVGRHCPTNQAAALYSNFAAYTNQTEWAMYGEMVHDNFICNVAGNGAGKVITSTNTTGVVSDMDKSAIGTLQSMHRDQQNRCASVLTSSHAMRASCVHSCY